MLSLYMDDSILLGDKMEAILKLTAAEYGYYAPVYSYYFSTGYFAWENSDKR